MESYIVTKSWEDRGVLYSLSKAFLFLLIVSINLREPFFHSREILFMLAMLSSFPYIDISKAKYALVLSAIWLISSTYNVLVPGSSIYHRSASFQTILVAAYLLILCFEEKEYKEQIIKSYLASSLIVGAITAVIWIACFVRPASYDVLKTFFEGLQEQTGLSLILIDRRAILGTRYLTVWYRTAPCMLCSLGLLLIRRMEDNRANTFSMALLSTALFMSGTRANILSVSVLLTSAFAFYLYKKNWKIITIILIITVFIAATLYGIQFINDQGSVSSAIKVRDFITYIDIFQSDPVRTLFFGWGVGSNFYSLGREQTVVITELSFFETIRRYGLVSSLIIIYYIWLLPLRIQRLRKNAMKPYLRYMFVITVILYIFTAFTNPYLLDSVGFCALVFFVCVSESVSS